MTILIVLVVVVLLLLFVGALYNGLVRKRNSVDNGWSQIDVQLKRRLDLSPNLVETVKGYAEHEREALEAVIAARNGAVAAPDTPGAQAAAEGPIAGALRQLFAVSEAYPDLKANTNFLSLQEELSATEGRIAYARQFYNDAVLRYHNGIDQVPGVIVAKMFSFDHREYFDAGPEADQVPSVSF